MLTLHEMQKILFEKDPVKRQQMIDALPEKEKDALLKEAEKLRQEGHDLANK